MKLFLDCANLATVKKFVAMGIVDGVTTNPSLLSKEGACSKQGLIDLCAAVPGPVSIEVVAKEPEAVYKQAREIAALAKNAVVKIPFAIEYLPVIARLAQEGIKLNITLVFSSLQALMVAKLGVTYISPFIGRIDDLAVDGMQLIEELLVLKNNYGFSTQILAASIRTVRHWQEAALAGADIATVPAVIIEQACKHPLTSLGIASFDADWAKLGKTSLFE
jgi:transaldolase